VKICNAYNQNKADKDVFHGGGFFY